MRWWRELRRAVDWADVVHWHFNNRVLPFGLDLRIIQASGKPRFVEFWGSDIRIPHREASRNRFYQQADASSAKWKRAEQASLATQRRFADAGFECLLPGPELQCHLLPDCFPAVHETRARLDLADFEPAPPSPDAGEPLIVHAPSHQGRKGTDAVLRAIAILKQRGRAFRFELIHDRSRADALWLIGRCDVYLDQFVLGAHGLAACEAMALGKPCVGYILPELREAYPPGLPIIQADPETLPDVLDGLLNDGLARCEAGRQGRAYVEKHHDARIIVRRLIDLYEHASLPG
jgi:glycosyltransferase involved in cell wall biosynthesis